MVVTSPVLGLLRSHMSVFLYYVLSLWVLLVNSLCYVSSLVDSMSTPPINLSTNKSSFLSSNPRPLGRCRIPASAHVYQQETKGTIAFRSGKSWTCQPGKQPEILQHASSGEQRQAESLPDGGGTADQVKSRPNRGDTAADQQQLEW
jgi:hypothetical protein